MQTLVLNISRFVTAAPKASAVLSTVGGATARTTTREFLTGDSDEDEATTSSAGSRMLRFEAMI